ncbi:hypothetical protein HU742_000940 [Pseudomonas sp. SWRI102]|uniref:Carbamoyl phosphate synthase ATP-binding domain-containing protein n=1 Tax=Pseudomonas marvdashtae TaxID=2745500 RepID=A0A923JQR3_9PSED|nr:hypothetical protein [Pseudomonas marvdashtae]
MFEFRAKALGLFGDARVFADDVLPVLRKIEVEVSWRHFDNLLRVNKLDETQSVQHRIFITEAPSRRVATVR